MAGCTDKTSAEYLDPAGRIAVFDMDGTILCEKAPVYIDFCLAMYRVLDDPSYHASEEEREAMCALVERYDIPYDHVVATDVPYVASGNTEGITDEYNMSREERIYGDDVQKTGLPGTEEA